MAGGWPKFLQVKLMPDGQLAVAIEFGNEILVGVVSLNGLQIMPKHLSTSRMDVRLVTMGSNFVSITKEQYDELTYYKNIPQYADVKLLGSG